MGFHGWGGDSYQSESADISGKFKAGLLLAGYVPASPNLHVGGYFAYSNSDLEFSEQGYSGQVAFDHYSVGFSLKAGKRIAERLWLGFVGDLGFYTAVPPGLNAYGVEVSPRIHLDLLAIDVGGFKMGPFASFGPSIVPYAANSRDARIYLIYIQLLLGITFGT
jgi:hypothetical protein